MTTTTIDTNTEAEKSTGSGSPMVRHLVPFDRYEVRETDEGAEANPAPGSLPTQRALCGYEWDRMHVRKDGPICEKCKAIHNERHPGAPLRI